MALSIRDEQKKLTPGMVGIASNTMGRYREFDISLRTVGMPRGTKVAYETSANIAFNFNNLCRKTLADKDLQWLWILGDDHILRPEILSVLIARGVEIVSPLCLQRYYPFKPVIYKYAENKTRDNVLRGEKVPPNSYTQIGWEDIEGKKGLLEVDACGNAGMLIRRSALEKIGDDWHRVGWQLPEFGASDLYFCKRATDNGIKIYVDLDNAIGHINHMALWPQKEKGDVYGVGIHEAWKVPESFLAKAIIEIFSKKS